MKAKERIPEQCEQPNTPLAPPREESEDQLAPWQREIVALAKARLSINGEQDVVFEMHRRAIGLCRVIEDMCLRQDAGSGIDDEAVAKVMQVVQEDIEVAKWITSGKPLSPNWF
jgi:hypothetical protein